MNNFNTVSVQFESGDQPRYTYKTLEQYAPGDMAIIKTKSGFFKFVHVVEVHSTPQIKPGINYTWLVQKLDTTDYDRLVSLD